MGNRCAGGLAAGGKWSTTPRQNTQTDRQTGDKQETQGRGKTAETLRMRERYSWCHDRLFTLTFVPLRLVYCSACTVGTKYSLGACLFILKLGSD